MALANWHVGKLVFWGVICLGGGALSFVVGLASVAAAIEPEGPWQIGAVGTMLVLVGMGMLVPHHLEMVHRVTTSSE